MIRLTFLAWPRRSTEKLDGAYVVVFVACDDAVTAERQARTWIEETGWVVEALEDSAKLEREEVSERERQYFDDALVDSGSLIFHCFPPSEE
ncbi:MAG: hypothetical protein L6Q99_08150 [Planctomycetes bacterium]|nr:hypothetical protein [Planctomycetota bacterium]